MELIVEKRIGKHSPITPEELAKETGYTMFAHNSDQTPLFIPDLGFSFHSS